MALTLAESAKLSQDDLQRGVIETFVIESVVLDRLPLMTIEGNSYAYNEEAALPGVEFRAVNAAYAESTGTFNQASERLVIMGGDADVDKFIARTRGNLNDQRAIQTRMKIKAATYMFQDYFINGDVVVDPNGFDGLAKRLVGAQVIDPNPGGPGIPVVGASDADRHAFLDALDATIAAVLGVNGSNGAIYVNANIRGKMRSSMRRLTIYDQTRDDFGRVVDLYNGIPILDIGETAAGAMILPQTETHGASVDCASIYVVRFGQDETDRAVTGLTNGGIQVEDLGEIDAKPVYRTRLEFYCGLAVFGGKAAARLTGIRNA